MIDSDIDIEVKKIFFIFKYRWKLGLFILIFNIVLSAIVAVQKQPQYAAVGKLLFKNNRTSVLTGINADVNEFQSLERDANPIVTEIEVLKSIPIAKKTIADLQLTNEESQALEPSKLAANLEINPLTGTDVVAISYQAANPDLATKVVDRLMNNYIQNSLLINRENVIVANQIITKQLPVAKAQVEEKEKMLQQFQEKNKMIFFDEESQAAFQNLKNLEEEIEQVEARFQEVQGHSAELQQQIGMNAQQSIAWNQLNQSPDVKKKIEDLQEVQSQLVKEQERFNNDHPIIISLQNQAADLENSLQQQIFKQVQGTSSQLSVKNLQILESDNLSQELTSALAEAEVEKQGLTRKLNSLKNIQRIYQQNAAQIPKLQNKFRNLKLQLESAQSKYKFLLEKSQELNLATQQNFDNVRIIESAQLDYSNAYSSSFLILGLGTSLGTILAISIMTGVHLIDKFIKSPEEIRGIFKYKLLGTIPNFHLVKNSIFREDLPSKFQELPNNRQLTQNDFGQQLVRLAVNKIPNSPISKAFWMLQAKFKLYNNDPSEKKIIVVSSSLRKEGKSLVTANLALTLSKLGHKVLIIDGDLHQASQQEFWQVSNDIGLSDVIIENKSVDSATVTITENLDLLCSGIMDLNPLTIIDSIKMKFLLWNLVKKYNFVIIDSPPLLEVPDAISLGKIADGIILVARLGLLDYSSANECQELLKNTGQNVLGLVINGVNHNNMDV